MKITKQRLKEIIKEELYRDDDAMRGADRPGLGIEDYPQTEPEEDPMVSHLGTPQEQLLSRILSRAVVDRYDSLQDLAADLGVEMTADMAHFIRSLKANPMYGSSEMEEGKVSGHRSEVTYSKSKRGQSKKPEKKAYNKAERAQSKRDVKKEKD